MEDPFLLELTGLAPADPQKGKSVLLSSTPQTKMSKRQRRWRRTS